MRRIVEFFVNNGIWANALIVLTLILGVYAFLGTKKAHFPETERRNVTISVNYPGASALEMDEGVTARVEQSLKGIIGIDEIRSTSSENSSRVNITIKENEDVEEVLVDIKNAVDKISRLPDGAEKPQVFKAKPTERAGMVALTGNIPFIELKRIANNIESEFLQSGVISEVEIQGFPPVEIAIEINEFDLLKYQLTMEEVATALRSENRDLSGGVIKTKQEELLIRVRNKKVEADDIAEIIVRSNANGSLVKLKDIARVKEQFGDVSSKSMIDGKRAVSFDIKKLPEEDLKDISVYLNDYVESFNDENEETSMLMIKDRYIGLEQRIDMLVGNGLYGLLFVLVALGLFLNIRLSIWVAWGIPASFLGMFIFGSFVDISINMISLFGMIVVVGILVDDGIVIAENIFAHFEKGKSPKQAAIDGTMEVLPSVFTSVATTVLAFIPLLMIEGNNFIAEMAIVVIFSLGFSLIEAVLVLPSHLAHKSVLTKEGWVGTVANFSDKIVNVLRDRFYASILRFFIRNKYVGAVIPVMLLIVVYGIVASGHITMTFFPSMQKEDFDIDIAFKPGEREFKTERYLRRFEEQVWEVNEEIIQEYGDTVVAYTSWNLGSTRQIGESGNHAGHVSVSLDIEDKKVSSLEVIRRVREKVGKIPEAQKLAVGAAGRWGKPVSINLKGKDLQELDDATEFLMNELKSMLVLREVSNNNAVGKNELTIKLKPTAFALGLNHQTITSQIRQAYFGEEVQRVVKGEEEVKIWIRYPEDNRATLGQLDNMMIKTRTGETYPLDQLVDYTIERGVTQVKRLDGARSVRVTAELADPTAELVPINNKIRANILAQIDKQYPGVSYTIGGQGKHGKRTVLSVMNMLPFVFMMMIVLISLNFKSFYQSLLILALIPVGLASATIGHAIHDIPLSVLSLFGALALGGIIVNDAVVMLDKFNQYLKEGEEIHEAAFKAGIARFRAIMLTSLTTVVGLAPLIAESNFQAKFIVPMAITMAYGVLIGTIFILLFFPAMILIANSLLRRFEWLYPNGVSIFISLALIVLILFPKEGKVVLPYLGGVLLIAAIRWIWMKKYKEPMKSAMDVEPAILQMRKEQENE